MISTAVTGPRRSSLRLQGLDPALDRQAPAARDMPVAPSVRPEPPQGRLLPGGEGARSSGAPPLAAQEQSVAPHEDAAVGLSASVNAPVAVDANRSPSLSELAPVEGGGAALSSLSMAFRSPAAAVQSLPASVPASLPGGGGFSTADMLRGDYARAALRAMAPRQPSPAAVAAAAAAAAAPMMGPPAPLRSSPSGVVSALSPGGVSDRRDQAPFEVAELVISSLWLVSPR